MGRLPPVVPGHSLCAACECMDCHDKGIEVDAEHGCHPEECRDQGTSQDTFEVSLLEWLDQVLLHPSPTVGWMRKTPSETVCDHRTFQATDLSWDSHNVGPVPELGSPLRRFVAAAGSRVLPPLSLVCVRSQSPRPRHVRRLTLAPRVCVDVVEV